MPAEGRLAPQAKVGVNARRGLSEEDERDIAKPLTTRRGLAYTYLVHCYKKHRAKSGQARINLLIIVFFQQRVLLLLEYTHFGARRDRLFRCTARCRPNPSTSVAERWDVTDVLLERFAAIQETSLQVRSLYLRNL